MRSAAALLSIALAVASAFAPVEARAEHAAAREVGVDQLLDLDLGRLLEVPVTLTARVEESAFHAASAIYVLTREDIRRSGLRRLPDLLRMVPGLHVGKWDANKWAIASRNGLTRFSSTMLVMIDGRHVYTPLFGGVRWETQDVMLEDIERIEVVRGPGGPLWGANAVDGIINVITRNARDTQGGIGYAGAGEGDMTHDVGVRYGATADSGVNWRLFAKDWRNDTGVYPPASESTHRGRRTPGDEANDAGHSSLIGVRGDWAVNAADSISFQANAFRSRFNEDRASATRVTPNVVEADGYNVMLDWKRQLGARESLQLKVWADRVNRTDDILPEDQMLADIELQHSIGMDRHTLTWGLGYRYYRNEVRLPTDPCVLCFALAPLSETTGTVSGFIQDQWALSDKANLTFGTKVERNDYTGVEYQPTVRGNWLPEDGLTLWLALTRPVRTPTRTERDGALYGVPDSLAGALPCSAFSDGICLTGNRDKPSWTIRSAEVGFRAKAGQHWSVDVAAFRSSYEKADVNEVKGYEAVVHYQPMRNWLLEASYTRHIGTALDASGAEAPFSMLPEHAAHFRSLLTLPSGTEVDLLAYYSSSIMQGTTRLPGYTRVDLRLAHRFSKAFGLSLFLSNLADADHPEYVEGLKVNTAARRAAFLMANFAF